MSRGHRAIPLTVASLSILLSVYSATADLTPSAAGATASGVSPLEVVPVAVFVWGTPLLGALLALRRPDNPIGWLFIVTALGWNVGFASDNLARHVAPGPAVAGLVTIAQQVSFAGVLALFVLLAAFPTGSLPSRRWRFLPVAVVVAGLSDTTAGLLTPGSPVTPAIPGLVNPFGQRNWTSLLGALNTIGGVALAVVVLGTAALLVVRIRRSSGVERQQLKWFVSAGLLTATLFFAALVVNAAAPSSTLAAVVWSLPMSSLVLLPASAAVAVLRYRLYEIDRIISRTLSYAILTAVLAGVYAVGLLGVGAIVSPFTNGGGPVAVAATTLLVVGLAAPLRRRLQDLVDRRFNRTRYDAVREIAQFEVRLRNTTDVEQVLGAMTETLERTMQPTSISVSMREARA